jgi:N-acetylmuramic acid 6-phosphate etherase
MLVDQAQIESFWQARTRFLHTCLSTEAPLTKTQNLSELCKNNLPAAITLFHQVELDALKIVSNYLDSIYQLSNAVWQTINNGGNIYITGCGASARLAVLLQKLWNLQFPHLTGRIIGVCSGGDISMIHSLEQFEDSVDYGVKQLVNFGFTPNDLLIGLSASGESPFILAGITYAKNNIVKPWLVCNNKSSDLIKRNPDHLVACQDVNTLALDVGAMALTGSTRLQATTAMQLAVASALLHQTPAEISKQLETSSNFIANLNLTDLAELTKLETAIIASGEYILYSTNNNLLGLSLLADITERSPTFNIMALENYLSQPREVSQFYLTLNHINSIPEVWQQLLDRAPNCLNIATTTQTKLDYFYGFDISKNSPRSLNRLDILQHTAYWQTNADNSRLDISLDQVRLGVNLSALSTDNITNSLVYKLLLNAHSTIMFGRLGAFAGNLMLSLKPSNNKLIDRTIRYALYILEHKHNKLFSYEMVANALFAEMSQLENNQSIVDKVVTRMLK